MIINKIACCKLLSGNIVINTQRTENAVIWQTGYELNETTGIVEPAQEIQIKFMRMEQ